MSIRSDKGRSFTEPESAWFWEVMKLTPEDVNIPFPDAWQHYDAGLSARDTVKLYVENEDLRQTKYPPQFFN
jgi:hypothetical protein